LYGGATYTPFLSASGKNWHFLLSAGFGLFWFFCKNLATIKKLFQNLNVCIILVLDATFVPNLTFLGLLSPDMSFGEKTVTHTDTQLISRSVNLNAPH